MVNIDEQADYEELKSREIELEKQYVKTVFDGLKEFVNENRAAFEYCWRFGDGCGGAILNAIRIELGIADKFHGVSKACKKKKISQSQRKKVFERDEYRCKHCGTHLDLTVDHIHPESKGGGGNLENLQTLCRSCNSKKGVKCEQ